MLDDENNKDDDLAKNNDAQDDEVMWLDCYLLGKFLYHMPKTGKLRSLMSKSLLYKCSPVYFLSRA